MTTAALPEFTQLAIAQLQLSDTPAQVERRKRFDKTSMRELAESITAMGVQQPIIVRRVNGHFQVVAGERRVIASKQAGLEHVPALVREFTDVQVLEVQLIENLQREDLHELVEAEGYETLMKQHKYTVEQLADKVGKSIASIYARLKLTALCLEARKAFSEDKINASIALLVARIPVHDLQRKAIKEIIKPQYRNEPLSFRQAKDHIHENYMLRLDQAPFPTGDADLVPKAGPCGSCPKRTGNQPELFGDVKSADVCTDPVCFGNKREANYARLAAEASGKVVISGAEARKLAPHGLYSYDPIKGHVKLDDQLYLGGKSRSYRSVIGKDVEVKHLQDPESGELVAIATEADVKAALKKRGFKDTAGGGGNDYHAKANAAAKKAKRERAFRGALYAAIRPKLATTPGRAELELVAIAFYGRRHHDDQKEILKLYELEPTKNRGGYGLDTEGPMLKRIAKFSDAELAVFLQDLVYIDELRVNGYSNDKMPLLLAAAKRARIDPAKLRRELEAAKKKPAKSK